MEPSATAQEDFLEIVNQMPLLNTIIGGKLIQNVEARCLDLIAEHCLKVCAVIDKSAMTITFTVAKALELLPSDTTLAKRAHEKCTAHDDIAKSLRMLKKTKEKRVTVPVG